MTDPTLDTDRIKELMRERDLNVGLAKCWMTYCRLADEVPGLVAEVEQLKKEKAWERQKLESSCTVFQRENERLKNAIRGAQLALNEGGDVWTTDHIDPQALSNERLRKRVEELEAELLEAERAVITEHAQAWYEKRKILRGE